MLPNYGDYMVTATRSWAAWAIRTTTHSPVNHAAIYIGRGFVVEAQPHGARIKRITAYPKALWSHDQIPLHVRLAIRSAAIDMIGTPYNFLDIAAQAIVRVFGWHAPKWVLNRVSNPRRLQCAQLVDEAYHRAGIELFVDGRPEGMISPEDLRVLMERKNG